MKVPLRTHAPWAVMALLVLLGPVSGRADELVPRPPLNSQPGVGICSEPIADVHAQIATVRALSAELTAATDRLEDLLAQEPSAPVAADPTASAADRETLDAYRRSLQTWQAQVEAQQQRIVFSRDQLSQAQQAVDAAEARMNTCIARETRSRLGRSRATGPSAAESRLAVDGEPGAHGAAGDG